MVPWCTARSIAHRDSKQNQIGQPAKRQVSSWRAGVGRGGRGSTGTPGGGRSRGGASKGTGAGGGRAGNRKWPGQMLGEEPRGPVGGRRIQNGRGGGPRSGGEPQGLRGWARVGRRIPRAPGAAEGRAGTPGAPEAGGGSQEHLGRAGRADCWTELGCGGVEKGIRIARTPMLLRRASGTVRASD